MIHFISKSLLRVLASIYHLVYKPVLFVGNSNSKIHLTLTNSVPVIDVSISDSKVWKLPKEVNENL